MYKKKKNYNVHQNELWVLVKNIGSPGSALGSGSLSQEWDPETQVLFLIIYNYGKMCIT